MEFRPSKRAKVVEAPSEYPHVLQLYLKPPDGKISLEEFEHLAYDRLKVLRILEQATLMGHKLFSPEWKTAVLGYLKKDGLRKYANLIQSPGTNSDTDADMSMRREDHVSHFILRLCYCRSADERSWFIAREVELFKLRFSYLNAVGLKSFISCNGLSYSPISEESKDEIKEGLVQSTYGYNHADIENKDFYRVSFIEVPNLVSKRMVYLKEGFAYIPSTELVSCIISLFRSNLSRELSLANKRLPLLDDERITSLVHSVHNTYTGKDYISPEQKDSIEVEDLDRLSQQSFPLCMRSLYDHIKSTHHMKHFGRLQFGLFLKGIGLTLENSIKYWKGEFTKLIDEDKFHKSYLYNIRHMYGTIGKMTNYTPYSCMKIISGSVGPGECHGCPFRHWELENIRKKMFEFGIHGDGIKDVLETVRNGHYQIACSKYFIHTHGGQESKALIGHPNQYFEESQEIRNNSLGGIKKLSQNRVKVQKNCVNCSSDPCVCPMPSTQENEVLQDLNPGDINWEETMQEDDERITSLVHSVHNTYTGNDNVSPEKKDSIEVEDLDKFSQQSFPLGLRSLYNHIKSTHHVKHFIHNTYTGKDNVSPEKNDSIEVEDLDRLSQQSFPLCMRSLYDHIKSTHHVKHFGRFQFGLFLKGIGLTLENSIKYWKGEFTKLIDEDKFNYSYGYNIRHMYGTIDKMTNYTPYSCMKIIKNGSVEPGECHGCPFKQWELEKIHKKMFEFGINSDGIKDVLEKVCNGHYQIACSKYFIHTHGGQESKQFIGHPNQYFKESQEIRNNSLGGVKVLCQDLNLGDINWEETMQEG